jgi:hypothetical protein
MRRRIDMSDNIVQIVKKHRAFYEVSPYYVMLEEKHGSPKVTIRKVQGGFDVDIYGLNIRKDLTFPGSDRDYALGYAELQKIAEEVSHHTSDSCVLEVFSFPGKIVFDNRNRETVEGMLQIRISHGRGLDQPAGLPEEHALKEVENQLHGMGVTRR